MTDGSLPMPTATRTCAKCGSVRMRPVGRSTTGASYFRCDECEHLTMEPPI